MTPSQKLRSIADSTGLDGIADAIREIANEIEHNNAPAVPQGYEIHEIPADYSGLVWLEGQVRAVARRAQAATGPQGWTDADSDAARLALELECLLMDTKNLSVVSKWWDSANDALELHRQRLAATTAPAPAQEVVLTNRQFDLICQAIAQADTVTIPDGRVFKGDQREVARALLQNIDITSLFGATK